MNEFVAMPAERRRLACTEAGTQRRLGRSDTERQSAYRQLFRTVVNKNDLEVIRESTNKGWELGNDRFKDKIEKLSGRQAAPKPRGRPRNED